MRLLKIVDNMKNAVDIRETLNVNVNVNATKQDNLKFIARVSMSANCMEFIEKKPRVLCSIQNKCWNEA